MTMYDPLKNGSLLPVVLNLYCRLPGDERDGSFEETSVDDERDGSFVEGSDDADDDENNKDDRLLEWQWQQVRDGDSFDQARGTYPGRR